MAQKTKSNKKRLLIIFLAVLAVAGVASITASMPNPPGKPDFHKPPSHDVLPPVPVPPGHQLSATTFPSVITPPPGVRPALPHAPSVATPAASPAPSSAELQSQDQSAAITILQNASHGAAMAVSTFTGPDGFVGVVYRTVSPSGGYLHGLAWVLPAKKMVFLGDLLDANGNMVAGPAEFSLHTIRHPLVLPNAVPGKANAVTTAPAVSSASPAATAAAPSPVLFSGKQPDTGTSAYLTAYNDGNSFVEGSSGPIVTIFFDPNSESAFALYKELSAETHKGTIRVRWVPIAVKGQTSLQRAEYILTAPSPAAALRLNFDHYDMRTHQGGAPLLSNMNMMSQVDQSTAILSIIGHPDSLVGFYCDQKTNSALPIYKPNLTFDHIQKLLPGMGYDCD